MWHFRSVRGLASATLLAVAGLCALTPGAFAHSRLTPKPAVYIYTETNSLTANAIVVFKRYSNGLLKQSAVVSTGGTGNTQSVGCGPGCPILDTSNEVTLAKGGKLLFAVNAGSNTVSSFRQTPLGLKLVDQKPSGGLQPESVTTSGNLVYVLNDNSGTISGFHVSPLGVLTPIPGSTQPLATPGPMSAGREISFDNTGHVLVVTEVATSLIDTFTVNSSGVASTV